MPGEGDTEQQKISKESAIKHLDEAIHLYKNLGDKEHKEICEKQKEKLKCEEQD